MVVSNVWLILDSYVWCNMSCFGCSVPPIKFVYFRNFFLEGFFFSRSLVFVKLYGVYIACRGLRVVNDLGCVKSN